MKKKIWLYKLTDATGTERVVVVDDQSVSGCIGGYDREGDWHEFHDFECAVDNIHLWALKYDMELTCTPIEIDLSEVIFE